LKSDTYQSQPPPNHDFFGFERMFAIFQAH
jgi:hypothetical protein